MLVPDPDKTIPLGAVRGAAEARARYGRRGLPTRLDRPDWLQRGRVSLTPAPEVRHRGIRVEESGSSSAAAAAAAAALARVARLGEFRRQIAAHGTRRGIAVSVAGWIVIRDQKAIHRGRNLISQRNEVVDRIDVSTRSGSDDKRNQEGSRAQRASPASGLRRHCLHLHRRDAAPNYLAEPRGSWYFYFFFSFSIASHSSPSSSSRPRPSSAFSTLVGRHSCYVP